MKSYLARKSRFFATEVTCRPARLIRQYFFQVSDTDSLWMWSRETLIPGLYATEWYNGKKMNKGWLANMEIYLVGVPRVRTLRVEEGKIMNLRVLN